MPDCTKTAFTSKRRAHESVRAMGNSVRVYYHRECGAFHVTKDRDKSDHGQGYSLRAKAARRDKLERQRKQYKGDYE